MLELVILGLLVGCAVLFQRMKAAELRIEELEDRQRENAARLAALASSMAAPEIASEPPYDIAHDDMAHGEDVTEAEEFVTPIPEPASVVPVAPAPAVTLRQSDNASVIGTERPAYEEFAVDEPPAKRFQIDFEDIFGRRLPIWAGGITLAIAGVFLVRYSIEAGLLTPQVRVLLSFLFGLGLLGAAEAAFRFEDRVRDERVRQALAGAGLATLYAAFYLAGTQYELIGQTLAFIGLASVTALAIFLSYRFGLPSAVLGLVGGFAAPALVGGEDANLPMLALYLALVTGGLTQTANRQKRSWLGLGALAGGLGWGVLLLIGGNYDSFDILALGIYFILLGTLVPAVLDIEQFEQPVRLAASGAAGLQLAVLVDSGGYQPLAWGLYLLLGAALAWFGWQRPAMRAGSAMAAAIGVVLLQLWPVPDPVFFALVAAALALVFAGIPLLVLRRKDGGVIEALSTAAVPMAIGLITLWTFDTLARDTLRVWEGLGLFVLAAVPAGAAFTIWPRPVKGELAANLASAGLLGFLATACLLPDTVLPLMAGAIATGLVLLLAERGKDSRSLSALPWAAAFGALVTLPVTDTRLAEIDTLFDGSRAFSILSFLRWLAAAAPFAALAWLSNEGRRRAAAEFIGGLIVFAALAQILPPIALVWVAAALVAAIRYLSPERAFAALALVISIGLWAITPVGTWLQEGIFAIAGDPMLVRFLPGLREVFGFILPLVTALAFIRIVLPLGPVRPIPLSWAALPFALIAAHVLFKQLFAIGSLPDFEMRGLAERTVWQALLLAAGWAAATRLKDRAVATAFAAASLAHFLCFTVLNHNPLWDHQAVGPVPLANLALASYAVGIGALWSLRLWWPEWRRFTDSGIMVLATLGGMTLLRQVFAGSYLDTLPMSQTEDLLRSLVGIVLAIAFLMIGSARGERLWRVGSLVLMTGTVLKVFIIDTAGLEGLLRIASFVALGASLIGIGWFYSRQLKAAPSEQ